MKNNILLPVSLVLVFFISAYSQDPLNPGTQREGMNGIYADFETATEQYLGVTTWNAFDCNAAATLEIVANPNPAGVNTSAKVAKFTTTPCTWEGANIVEEFVPMNMNRNLFRVDVYAPEAGRTVLLKLEKFSDSAVFVEVQATTTVANEWETLIFDFSGAESGVYGKVAVFPDFNGTAEEVWYFDNIWQYREPILYKDGMLADFEGENLWFHLWDCNDGTAELQIIDNPYPDEVNDSPMCAYTYTSGCEWEGFANDEKFAPFEWDEQLVFTLQVFSPFEGRQVNLKLENYEDKSINKEVQATTTVAGEWEELIFNFTNLDLEQGIYSRVAIFPDFYAYDEEIWLFDNLRVEGATTMIRPIQNIAAAYDLQVNNYPNPFNPQTVISYTLPVNGQVELSVYDINGRQVTTLVNDNQQAGAYQVVFDGANLASGVYFYKLFTGNRIVANKMLLVR